MTRYALVSHSFTNLLFHVVYSTKERRPWLTADVRPRLFAYIGGLIRQEGGVPLRINGVPDHVHLLAKLRQDTCVSNVVRVIKAKSSRWAHQTFAGWDSFCWQTGYGAFSVSQSQAARVQRYIDNQEEHHRGRTYQDEFRTFLRAHGVEASEEDMWD